MPSNIFRIQNNIFELQLLNNEQFPLFMQNYSKKTQQKAIGTQCSQAITLPSTD